MIDNEINRKTWIREILQNLRPGVRILDVGAGELANKQYCAHLQYVSQDFCQYEGSGDGKGLQMGQWDTSRIDIVSDITAIPVDDGSFDAVVCTEVLEHVPDPVRALTEMARVVKPGGTLILTVPFASLTHFAPFHFSTGFNSYFFSHHLPRLGFDDVQIEKNGDYLQYLLQEVIRIPYILNQYHGHKVTLKDRIVLRLMRDFLGRFMKPNSSSEVLCFGLHVKARKKS